MSGIFRIGLLAGCLLAVPAMAQSKFETYGDIGQLAIPALAAGYAWYQGDTEGLYQLGKSAAATEATVMVLKYSINEKRPNGQGHGFPSGHSALTFSGASFLYQRYGWEFGAPALLAATAVGWSRVSSKQHYWHDVIAGAAIASGFTWVFTTPQHNAQFAFYPTRLADRSNGIGWTVSM